MKEKVEPPPADLRRLGLAKRDSEVLFYLSMSKTNKEIASLYAISRLTAEKYLENIYSKLGVQARLSATAMAVETMTKIA